MNLIRIYKLKEHDYVTYVMSERSFEIQAILKAYLLQTKGVENRHETRQLPSKEEIKGTFMFGGGKNWVNHLFETGFGGIVMKGQYKAQDIIKSSTEIPSVFYSESENEALYHKE